MPPFPTKRHGLIALASVAVLGFGFFSYASSSGLLMETRFESFLSNADASTRVNTTTSLSAPVITNVSVANVTATTATVSWLTNIPADSRLRVWISKPYGLSFTDPAKVTTHTLTATGLLPNTRYEFVARSSANGKLTTSQVGTFTTSADVPPSPTPTPVPSVSPSTTPTPLASSSPSSSPIADASWDTAPYSAFPIPALPPLPASGGVITDPTFGTAIMRVTNAQSGAGSNISYSYWPTFNQDSTKLYIYNDAGVPTYYDFDPSNFRLGAKHAMFVGGNCATEDAIWSSVNPSIMFCHSLNGTIFAYNVVTQAWTTIKATGMSGSQMSKSSDDQVFAWTWKDANYQPIGYVVYNRATDTIKTFSATEIDEVQVDKSGRYIVYKTGLQGAGIVEVKVIDLQTNMTIDLLDDVDYAPGHSDNGLGVTYGADNWLNRILSRNLSTPKQWKQLVQFPDWSQAQHISALSNDESVILISNFTGGGGGAGTGQLRDEIFLVATNGSGGVKHLLHHHSVFRDYWDTPRASMSMDGRFVTFASNWGRTGTTDVFVAKVK